MAIYFANKGVIDLDTIRIMGVSVKGDNAIGRFGTGIKYGISTFLRTGHTVSLYTNGETVKFTTKPKEIRGKEFNLIYMDDEPLGFTTDLGKDWQVWQAYREFYSNCLDEGGVISGRFNGDYDTVFSVEGPDIANVHAERNKIFLQGEPWIVGDGVDVYRGQSSYVYYRGVRVHKLMKPSRFTYNFTTEMKLSEDRELSSVYDMNYKLGTRLPQIAEPEFCQKVLDPEWEGLESELSFQDCGYPSEEFLDGIQKFKDFLKLKQSRRDMLRQHRKHVKEDSEYKPEQDDMQMLAEACKMLESVNCYVRPSELTFVEHLGPNIMAAVRGGKMILTRQCIANGRDYCAITIYEEWIHDRMGYQDESRGMQQFLFDKILELIKRERGIAPNSAEVEVMF